MELEIEEKLQETYQDLIIEVEYVKPLLYNITIVEKDRNNIISYKYQKTLTFNVNIDNIKNIINRLFRR